MDSLKKWNVIAAVFVTAVFLFLLLPPVFAKGMFLDGVVYATVSRNLSIGLGSFWHLHYTSTLYPEFFEHPPLAFYIQSLFYDAFGDHFYVEKVFTFVNAVATAILIALVWRKIFKHTENQNFFWIPLLFWVITPVVFWSFSNNMLENTLSVFVLLSVFMQINAIQNSDQLLKFILFSALSGIFLFATFLTKGFTGLFPFAFPFLYFFANRTLRIPIAIYITFIAILSMVLLYISFIAFNPEAIHFFKNYFDIQVLKSISGNREITHEGRLYIVPRLFSELIPMLGIVILIVAATWKHRLSIWKQDSGLRKNIFLFGLLGICGSLPLLISPKQQGYYLVPSIPFFALCFSVIALGALKKLFEKPNKILVFFRYFSFALLVFSLIYAIAKKGTFLRDKALIQDIEEISKIIPPNSTLSAPFELFDDWGLRALLARIGKISIDCENQQSKYYIQKKDALNSVPSEYSKIITNRDILIVYKEE